MNDTTATGLRRRRGVVVVGGADAVEETPRHMEAAAAADTDSGLLPDTTAIWKLSRLYCSLSAFVAILAIVTAQTNTFGPSARGSVFFDTRPSVGGEVVETASTKTTASTSTSTSTTSTSTSTLLAEQNNDDNDDATYLNWWNVKAPKKNSQIVREPHGGQQQQQGKQQQPAEPFHPTEPQELPPWVRWILFPGLKQDHHSAAPKKQAPIAETTSRGVVAHALVLLQSCLDPGLLDPTSQTLTDLIDKVIHSTPRLLAIANLLLALTFMLHTAVADWFLGTGGGGSHGNGRTGNSTAGAGAGTAGGTLRHAPQPEWAAAGRERLGGFLVFKLLLISAVVGPDTLDLLILLSWYTLLSFLRSLAHLCAGTTQHTVQSGQPARPGVLHLLLALLVSDFVAAAVCVALFHGAGWGMVVLLTCDCALLAVDVVCNILSHAGQVLEAQHADRVTALEGGGGGAQRQPEEDLNLDRQRTVMARLEQQQVRRVYILETTVFGLQIFKHLLTVLHFVHIWSLYGVQFTLIDGVLALHLHSALSSASKKIAERRNLYRIARDMDGMFEDATEMELRKATAAGDKCCICLGTLTMGNVKKVGCGHLHHTSCLREVIERERSMEATRCPLCRASIMNEHHRNQNRSAAPVPILPMIPPPLAEDSTANTTDSPSSLAVAVNATAAAPVTTQAAIAPSENSINENDESVLHATNREAPASTESTNATGLVNNSSEAPSTGEEATVVNPTEAVPPVRNPGDHALFRFSTEGVLPGWVPLPSFSFEVIRRPNMARQQQQQQGPQQQPQANNNNAAAAAEPSLFRRLLVVSGMVPMSPEEEQAELDRLIDTFPQYDRPDLLRELRRQGSADAVARSILDRQEFILPAAAR